MSFGQLMEIIETLIFSKVNQRPQAEQMQAQNITKNISITQLPQAAAQTAPAYIEPQNIKDQDRIIPNTTNEIRLFQQALSVHLQNPSVNACTAVPKPKRSFFRPHQSHRIKPSPQSQKSKNQQLVLQNKMEVNQIAQQATHLQIDCQKQNGDQQSSTIQLISLQTKLEPVDFIVLVQPIEQDQGMERKEKKEDNERMKQKSKRINFKRENSKQIIQDELNLAPVSFKVILKVCEDIKAVDCTNKLANDQDQPQKAAILTNKKSYLSHQIINKYPMMLKNISLETLLSQAYQNRLISMALFEEWTKNRKNIAEVYFLRMFSQERLQQFPFDKIKFTLLDHRRLSEVLISIFPQKYRLGDMKSIQSQQNQFIAGIYDISAPQYYELCSGVDKISKVKWWLKLVIVHQNKLSGIALGIQQKQPKQPLQEKNLFEEFFNIASNEGVNTARQKKIPPQKSYFRLNQTIDSNDNIFEDKRKDKKIIKPRPKKGKQQQISEIRNLVSGFGKRRMEMQQPQQNPRKKIKFS